MRSRVLLYSCCGEGERRLEGHGGGLHVHSFTGLLAALATLTRDRVRLARHSASLDQLAEQTPLQRRAFELLDVDPCRP